MKKVRTALMVGAVIALPYVALAQTAQPRTLKELAALVVKILNAGTSFLVLVALVLYLFGITRSLMRGGEQGLQIFKTYVFWGILSLFIMVSIWGILALLQATLFEGASYNPTTGGQTQGGALFAPGSPL